METTSKGDCGCIVDATTGVVTQLCERHLAEAEAVPPPAASVVPPATAHTAVAIRPAGGPPMTPEQFRSMLTAETDKRAALLDYIRAHFRDGVHFARTASRYDKQRGKRVIHFYGPNEPAISGDEPRKPCLLQPGAQTATLVMQCKPVFVRDDEVLSMLPEEARGRVVAVRCLITSLNTGEVIGEGRGACSLAEKDDNINTVIQIACKRSHVAAARGTFALSDLYEQGPDELAGVEPNGDPPDAPPPDTTRPSGAAAPKPAPGSKVKRPPPKVPSPPGAGAGTAPATRSPPVADGPAPAPAGDGSQVEPDAVPPPDDGRVRSSEIPALLEACGTDADRAGVVISYLRGAKHPRMFDAMWVKAFKITAVNALPPECKERIRTAGGKIKTALVAAQAADEPPLKESWR